jgi:hypothetical protein
MKKNDSEASMPPRGAAKPTKEQVVEWVKRDFASAHYFLGVMLRYPEIMESCAEQIIAHVNAKENGAAIETVKQEADAS